MKFKHTNHTQKYFSECKNIVNHFIKFDWSSTHGFSIDMNKGDDNLKYQFLKISSKLFTKIQETKNKRIDNLLNDPNVLSLGIINMSANSTVEIHKDHDYWSEPFYRMHIPLNSPGAYFIYDDEKIVWETEKVYIFDVMRVSHGAINETNDNFEMIYVDITQQPVVEKIKSPLDDLIKEYQEQVLETIPSDLIFTEYKKYCTEEELNAEKQYLDSYKRNLEIG